MCENIRRDSHLRDRVCIALEDLDCAPTQRSRRYLALDGLLDMRDCVLNGPRKHMGNFTLATLLRILESKFRGLAAALALLSADTHDLAVETLPKLLEVNLVPRAIHQVHHVDGHHHRHADLGQLRGQVEITLDVRAVHNVQDRGGLLVHQKVPRDLLLERVGRERVDTRQILHDDVLVSLQCAVLLLNRHARPVADVLV